MRRDASAGTVCWPRSKLCKIPRKQKKPEISIDLNRWAAGGAGNFLEAVGDGAGHFVEALRGGRGLAERGNGRACNSTDASAGIDFTFAEHRHAVRNGGLRGCTVAEADHRVG